MSESPPSVKFYVRIRNTNDDKSNTKTNFFIHKGLNNKLVSLQKPIKKTLTQNDLDDLNEYLPSIIQVNNVFDENE